MYEVYALKYGERDTTMCQFFYREHRHEPLTLHYFVWLIMGGPHPVLVDTGFRAAGGGRRGRDFLIEPLQEVRIVCFLTLQQLPRHETNRSHRCEGDEHDEKFRDGHRKNRHNSMTGYPIISARLDRLRRGASFQPA